MLHRRRQQHDELPHRGRPQGGHERVRGLPPGYRPPQEILEFAAGYGEKFTLTDDPKTAAKDADVVITDVWTSMGQEEERASGPPPLPAISQRPPYDPHQRGVWYSTACRHTEARRSQKRFLKRMQMKYLKRQKTAFTHRRPLWSC